MADLTSFIENIYLGNSLKAYLIAFVVFVVVFLFTHIFQKILLIKAKRFVKKTKIVFDDVLVDIIETIKPSLYRFFSFWVALNLLNINPKIQVVANVVLLFLILLASVQAIKIFVEYIAYKKLDKDDPASESIVSLLITFVKVTVWMFGGVLLLSNLGINVTSLVAGLGVGGIAFALASQRILGDLFSSFSIYFDKPFVVGDFVVTDNITGTIERIGVKTTRIRAITGEEVVVSNESLTDSIIHNYRDIESRRVVFSLGVTYDTSVAQLKDIPNIIENIISSVEIATFDRAHFHQFGDSAYLFEVVYFVLASDYKTYMDLNEKIHLDILEKFNEEKIEFAFPTETHYIVDQSK